jgi:hypothetical protein
MSVPTVQSNSASVQFDLLSTMHCMKKRNNPITKIISPPWIEMVSVCVCVWGGGIGFIYNHFCLDFSEQLLYGIS